MSLVSVDAGMSVWRRGWDSYSRRFAVVLLASVAMAAEPTPLPAASAVTVHDTGLGAWLKRLPEALVSTPILAPPIDGQRQLGPGVAVRLDAPARVVMGGWLVRDTGPDGHGLESLICLAGGRTHESLICTDSSDALLIKQAFLAAFAWPDGQGSNESSSLPVRGVPVAVEIAWRDRQGLRRTIPASCAVRDRITGRAFPPLPYIYTGSRLVRTDLPTAEGGTTPGMAFLLAESRTLVANNDDSGELIGSPLPQDAEQMRYDVAPGVLPPPDTSVELVFARAELPLMLRVLPDGGLSDSNGARLDDTALAAVLRTAFATATPTTLRAVAIAVTSSAPRTDDAALAARVLAAAVQAQVWCLPIFTLADR